MNGDIVTYGVGEVKKEEQGTRFNDTAQRSEKMPPAPLNPRQECYQTRHLITQRHN